ncbi:sensor histidine kinase [Arthrobacter citreus]|nr:sensor histidine kinase [Arthrobacter citreus]
MSFFQYIKDKRYFFILYGVMMIFVSIMMMISTESNDMINNLLYTNLVCLFFVAVYILLGYFRQKAFYKKIVELTEQEKEELILALPKPQTINQTVYHEVLKKLHNEHTLQIQRLLIEKLEHQEFVLSWIHEVKLPIAASKLIMEHSTGKSLDELVDKLEDELNKIDYYVEQALYYSRIDSFSKDYFITEINLNQIIKSSVKKYAKLFINKEIGLSIANEAQFVQSDPKWLSFITDQIVSNSLKYTNDKGTISFYYEDDQKEKRLIIEDTGVGIPPQDLNRVFEKGFTGNNGRTQIKSTGMGLYLAKQLAIKLGHNLSIQSEEGLFTKVIIHFPKVRNYYQLQ